MNKYLTTAEMADELGVTQRTVGNRYKRMRLSGRIVGEGKFGYLYEKSLVPKLMESMPPRANPWVGASLIQKVTGVSSLRILEWACANQHRGDLIKVTTKNGRPIVKFNRKEVVSLVSKWEPIRDRSRDPKA